MASVAMRPCAGAGPSPLTAHTLGGRRGREGGGEDDDLRDCYANLKHCSGANEPNE